MPPFRLPSAADVAARAQKRQRTSIFEPSVVPMQQEERQQVTPAQPQEPVMQGRGEGRVSPPSALTPNAAESASDVRKLPVTNVIGSAGPTGTRGEPSPMATSFNANAILVSRRQQGNPVLRAIRNVQWQFGESSAAADFVLSESCCALFLSLRYHLLHPDYLLRRIRELSPKFNLRLVGDGLEHLDVCIRMKCREAQAATDAVDLLLVFRCSCSSIRRTRRSLCLTSRESPAAATALRS